MSQPQGFCAICSKSSVNRCSRCKSVYYCSAEHQKGDWPNHKKVCSATNQAASSSPVNTPKAIVPANPKDHVATFVQWLKENDVQGLEEVEISDFETTGRGLKAKKDIASDSVVLSIPRRLFVTLSDTLRTHSELSKVFSDLSVWSVVSQVPDAILAIRLLYEKHSAPNSPWKPWIDVLPKSYNSTLFWTHRDLALLEGGNIHQMTQLHKQQTVSDYVTIVKQTLAKRFPLIFKTSVYTESEYLWAIGTVFSRATEGILDGGHQRYIVPMMDMCNHSFEAVAKHGFNEKANAFEIVSTNAIGKDAQVYINYGPMGNAKLLHVYGFTVPNNPFDYVQLFLNMSPEAEIYEEKKKRLAERGFSPNPSFYLRLDQLDQFPMDILGTVRIQRLMEHDLDRAEYAYDPVHIISEENEVYALKSLEEGIKSMFMAYQIPYQVDLETAEKLNKGDNTLKLSENEIHALHIRLGDRLVLGKAGGLIVEKMQAIQQHLMEKINSGNTTPLVPEP